MVEHFSTKSSVELQLEFVQKQFDTLVRARQLQSRIADLPKGPAREHLADSITEILSSPVPHSDFQTEKHEMNLKLQDNDSEIRELKATIVELENLIDDGIDCEIETSGSINQTPLWKPILWIASGVVLIKLILLWTT